MIQVHEALSAIVDRETILFIKLSKCLRGSDQWLQLCREHSEYFEIISAAFRGRNDLLSLRQRLYDSNVEQWALEDTIRLETANVLDSPEQLPEAQLQRSLYLAQLIRRLHVSNHRRNRIKAEIDRTHGDAPEVKLYAAEETYNDISPNAAKAEGNGQETESTLGGATADAASGLIV